MATLHHPPKNTPKDILPTSPMLIKRLVRQHVHDVRNYVNCVGMEIAIMEDTIKEQDALDNIESIRNQLHELDGLLRGFVEKFADFPDSESGSSIK